MQGWERHAERLDRRGLMVSWESQTDSQAARLAKVPVQRVGQKEIGSGQLDRAQETGQSKRVLGGLSVGAGESSQAPGILSLEGRKC